MEGTLPLILEVLDDIDHFNILVLPSLNRCQTKLLKVPLMSFAHFTTCRHEFHALRERQRARLAGVGRPLICADWGDLFLPLPLPSLATRWLRRGGNPLGRCVQGCTKEYLPGCV